MLIRLAPLKPMFTTENNMAYHAPTKGPRVTAAVAATVSAKTSLRMPTKMLLVKTEGSQSIVGMYLASITE